MNGSSIPAGPCGFCAVSGGRELFLISHFNGTWEVHRTRHGCRPLRWRLLGQAQLRGGRLIGLGLGEDLEAAMGVAALSWLEGATP